MPSENGTTVFSDNFNRADSGDLGANWDGGYSNAFSIAGNQAVVTTLSIATEETFNTTALGDNQFVQATVAAIGTDTSSFMGLMLFAAAPATRTWYEVRIAATGGTETTALAYRNAGTGTTITNENATTWAVNDILRFERDGGGACRVYRNGTLLLSGASHGAPSTGTRAGMRMANFSASAANWAWDTFSAGNTVAMPVMIAGA